MFPTQSKVNRLGRLWLLPVIALALLLAGYLAFTSSQASAQTPDGEYCIEGIVINWEEKPLAGWQITLTSNISGVGPITTTSALEPDEDDDDPDFQKGEFEFKEEVLLAAPAVYTVEIESRVGWEGVTPTTISFPINESEHDCVKIRFKMRRIVLVDVIKIDVNHIGLEDWRIQAAPGPGNLFASPEEEETDIDGVAFFTLTPGVWIFSELPPKQDMDSNDPAERFVPVVPPNGQQTLNILDSDGISGTELIPLTVVFKNESIVGCVLVQKEAAIVDDVTVQETLYSGSYAVGGWAIALIRKDGEVVRQGVTDAKGQIRFDNLPLGPYTLIEEDRPGWNEVSGRALEINVENNDCENQPITFTNEQDDSGYSIEGYKIDANGGYGIPNWKIEIEPLDKGGYDPDDVYTDGRGFYTVEFPRNDYRIPGALYEVCEEDKDGWLPHTDTCQEVRLPEWPGEPVKLHDFVNQQVGHSESEKMWGDMENGNGENGNGEHGNGENGNGMDMGPQPMGPSSMGPDKGMSCSTYHVAKEGEGLYDIGRMYHKTPTEMLKANPDVANHPQQWVIAGQKICIP